MAYSALAKLGLTEAELQALATQGSVHPERRSPNRMYYKLWYRVNGRQKTRYLGTDADFADQVAAELMELQTERRMQKRLGQLTRSARQLLRTTKKQLEPQLEEAGFKFHGNEIRIRITKFGIRMKQ